jgi:hypothetical protein
MLMIREKDTTMVDQSRRGLHNRAERKRSSPVGGTPPVDGDLVGRLKEQILEKVQCEGHVTFLELGCIEGFVGDYEISNQDVNVVIWPGISEEAIQAIFELQQEQLIHFAPCSLWAYSWSGGPVPDLPIAKHAPRGGRFSTTHWGPTELCPGSSSSSRSDPRKRVGSSGDRAGRGVEADNN